MSGRIGMLYWQLTIAQEAKVRVPTILFSLAVACTPGFAGAAPPTYSVTNLDEKFGRPGLDRLYFYGINDFGTMTGLIVYQDAALSPGDGRAAIFNLDGTIREIGSLGGYFPGKSAGHAINGLGQVAGVGTVGYNTPGPEHAFLLWGPDASGLIDLGAFYSRGANATDVRGLNDSSVVVGRSNATVGPQAYKWSLPTGMVALEHGGAAEGINSSGHIVGYGSSPNGTAPTVWSPDGAVRFLNSYYDEGGATFSGLAAGINDHNEVVGTYTKFGSTNLFKWSEAAGWSELGHLPGVTDTAQTSVIDINDAGQVIGFDGRDGSGVVGDVFLWTPADGMMFLDSRIDPGDPYAGILNLQHVRAMNDAGQIIAFGVVSGTVVNVLLTPTTPIPEPGTWLLLLGGGIALASRRTELYGAEASCRWRCAVA